jgi:hypothetical protein
VACPLRPWQGLGDGVQCLHLAVGLLLVQCLLLLSAVNWCRLRVLVVAGPGAAQGAGGASSSCKKQAVDKELTSTSSQQCDLHSLGIATCSSSSNTTQDDMKVSVWKCRQHRI